MEYSTDNLHQPDACGPACVDPDTLLALLWRLDRELDATPIRAARSGVSSFRASFALRDIPITLLENK
jgi:hypothetical protein